MRIAIDCDLHRIHAITDTGRVLFKNCNDVSKVIASLIDFVNTPILYEIAAPVAYRDGKASHFNLAKWMIWNTAQATILDAHFEILVAPSSVWTHGYKADVRQKLAKATASTHDLRECQAMLYMHGHHPADWIPLSTYLEKL